MVCIIVCGQHAHVNAEDTGRIITLNLWNQICCCCNNLCYDFVNDCNNDDHNDKFDNDNNDCDNDDDGYSCNDGSDDADYEVDD